MQSQSVKDKYLPLIENKILELEDKAIYFAAQVYNTDEELTSSVNSFVDKHGSLLYTKLSELFNKKSYLDSCNSFIRTFQLHFNKNYAEVILCEDELLSSSIACFRDLDESTFKKVLLIKLSGQEYDFTVNLYNIVCKTNVQTPNITNELLSIKNNFLNLWCSKRNINKVDYTLECLHKLLNFFKGDDGFIPVITIDELQQILDTTFE